MNENGSAPRMAPVWMVARAAVPPRLSRTSVMLPMAATSMTLNQADGWSLGDTKCASAWMPESSEVM